MEHTSRDIGQRALALFRSGKDTVQISHLLKVSESVASSLVYGARCREKVLPIETVTYRSKRRVA